MDPRRFTDEELMKDRRDLIFRTTSRHIPKEQPPGTVVPTLNDRGQTICPTCGRPCNTPIEPNPYNGFVEEKCILRRGMAGCPHEGCRAVHWITDELALRHNRYWYPDDPQYAETDDGIL